MPDKKHKCKLDPHQGKDNQVDRCEYYCSYCGCTYEAFWKKEGEPTKEELLIMVRELNHQLQDISKRIEGLIYDESPKEKEVAGPYWERCEDCHYWTFQKAECGYRMGYCSKLDIEISSGGHCGWCNENPPEEESAEGKSITLGGMAQNIPGVKLTPEERRKMKKSLGIKESADRKEG